MKNRFTVGLAGLGLFAAVLMGSAAPAAAAPTAPAAVSVQTAVALPVAPTAPTEPTVPGETAPGGTVTVDINGANGKPSNAVIIMIGMTVLSVAPALLLLCTSFTKIFVVLSITFMKGCLVQITVHETFSRIAGNLRAGAHSVDGR